MTFRAIAFDLDGTLVDSLRDITIALNEALSASGFPTHTPEWAKRTVGHGVAQLITDALPEGTAATTHAHIVSRFVDFYLQHPCDTTEVYPGVLDTLATLHARGCLLGVISNKMESIVRLVVTQLGLAPFFSVIWGADSWPEKKPSPLPLRHFMRLSHASPSTTLMVGDGPADVLSAKAAGTHCCHFTGGYGSLAGLGLTPEFCIHHMSDLVPTLDAFTS